MKNKIANRLLTPFYAPLRYWLRSIHDREEANAILLGQTLSHLIANGPDLDDLRKAEFQVFSQFGEDGIIQYLLSRVPIAREIFVEFGVENYVESNTRFLLLKSKWSGLVMDGNGASIESVNRREVAKTWRLRAVTSFITCENINETIRAANIEGDVGILSIDIDGNDYWIWKAIDVIQPRIVISEVNIHFGAEHAITIPYKPDFRHVSTPPFHFYHGASLRSLCLLAEEKGYDFVGCTSEGVNAFFVRKDLSGRLRKLDAQSAHSQIKTGRYISPPRTLAKLRPIGHLEVYDVEAQKTYKISDLLS